MSGQETNWMLVIIWNGEKGIEINTINVTPSIHEIPEFKHYIQILSYSLTPSQSTWESYREMKQR